jgi:hypothetical protein
MIANPFVLAKIIRCRGLCELRERFGILGTHNANTRALGRPPDERA